jgi:thioredoxin-like negative regulator of GroEL
VCKELAPVVHGLERDWKGRIKFVYLDIDDPRTDEFKRQLGYQYQPHLLLLDPQGKILQQWVGYVTADQLTTAFAAATQ